jgi:hypothetical protein
LFIFTHLLPFLLPFLPPLSDAIGHHLAQVHVLGTHGDLEARREGGTERRRISGQRGK